MLQEYKTETRKDGNGESYEVRVPINSSIITSESLAPEAPVQIPQPQIDTTNYDGITGGVTESILNDFNNLNKQLGEKQKSQEQSGNDIVSMMKQLTNKTADTQQANELAGVNTETENLNKYVTQLGELNAQASSLNREAQAIPLITQERNANTGATDRGIAPQNASALRLNAIKALSIAQQSDIAYAAATGSQMRLNTAKDKAQQIIDLKYKPIEEMLAIKEKQYELNKDVLETYDKKRTEALALAIDKEKTVIADKKAKEKSNSDVSLMYAKYAMDAGQSDLASEIQSLDPSSPTYGKDLSTLQAKIKNPSLSLDLAIKEASLAKMNAEIIKTKKETSLLGQPTPADVKAEKAALAKADSLIPVLNDKITAVDVLKNHPGLSLRVGPNALTRSTPVLNPQMSGVIGNAFVGAKDFLTGNKPLELTGIGNQFSGGIHKLVSQEFLDKLIEVKAQGATFGALTDREADSLRAAATAISDWEVKDKNGKGTGVWNIDEASFKKELETVQTLARRAIGVQEGNIMSPDEKLILDKVFINTDPSAFY